jgi:hypothetical protein
VVGDKLAEDVVIDGSEHGKDSTQTAMETKTEVAKRIGYAFSAKN